MFEHGPLWCSDLASTGLMIEQWSNHGIWRLSSPIRALLAASPPAFAFWLLLLLVELDWMLLLLLGLSMPLGDHGVCRGFGWFFGISGMGDFMGWDGFWDGMVYWDWGFCWVGRAFWIGRVFWVGIVVLGAKIALSWAF
jgi:hypothetical protein